MIIQASLSHPETVEALGHNVPRVFMLVFGGGCALAGLAGVIGGNAFVTEPGMAVAVGSIIFVVVVFGGMGSLTGAFIASLLLGAIQTFAVALDWSLMDFMRGTGSQLPADSTLRQFLSISIAQAAPVLPYLLMVLMLIVRPTGLLGTRET
jgi:branched-chain amino acid transport system permease protein